LSTYRKTTQWGKEDTALHSIMGSAQRLIDGACPAPKEMNAMQLQSVTKDIYSSTPVNCWLVRRETQQNSEEYVARFEATALMIWDYMQKEVMFHSATAVKMALVWRPESGNEQTLARMEIEAAI
jgi:hypothetical protein